MAGTYPSNEDMAIEMDAVALVFEKYNVQVFRPMQIHDCNQIFTRDIGFVIDDVFVKANILPDREEEIEAIQYIVDQIDTDHVMRPPEEVHIEGGDVMLHGDHIFVGTYRGEDYPDYIIARTNVKAV
jgi:N-dimethylarginine dimethylaminohydrolase